MGLGQLRVRRVEFQAWEVGMGYACGIGWRRGTQRVEEGYKDLECRGRKDEEI